MSPVLALHGGAGASRKLDYAPILIHMRGLVELARDRLMRGEAALEIAVAVVAEMERSGLYVAGRGGSPNLAGEYELDAALMDGRSGAAGAVGALQGFQSPNRGRAPRDGADRPCVSGRQGRCGLRPRRGSRRDPGRRLVHACRRRGSQFCPRPRRPGHGRLRGAGPGRPSGRRDLVRRGVRQAARPGRRQPP